MSRQDHDNTILTKIVSSEVKEVGKSIDLFISDGEKSLEDTRNFYNKWAETYEGDLKKSAYNNPQAIAKEVVRILNPESDPSYPDDVKILDIACGTGLVSSELRKSHIKNIDGLDGSESMLSLAKNRHLYKNYFCEMVVESKLKSVEDKTYDMVVTTGSFCPGHLNSSMLSTITRPIKPGGSFFMAIRTDFMQHPYLIDLEEKMESLCASGYWKLVSRSQFPDYFDGHEGTLFHYQIL